MAAKRPFQKFMRTKSTKLHVDLNNVVLSSVSADVRDENVDNDCGRSTFVSPFGVLGGKKKRPVAPKKKTTEQNVQDKCCVEKILKFGIRACPQCQIGFDHVNSRPIQEACGHIKCRACFIQSLSKGENYCHQCALEESEALKLEKSIDIKTPVLDTADLIRAARSSKCTVRIERIDIDLTSASKKLSQMKVKTLDTCPSQSPNYPPVSLTRSDSVLEQSSESQLILLDKVHRSNVSIDTFGHKTESKSIPTSNPPVKLVENGSPNLAKKVPKVTIQIESKDCQINASRAKVKCLNSKKKNKINTVGIPDHITVFNKTRNRPILYNCTNCSKIFKTKAHIKYHKFCGENASEKPYKCDECGSQFVSKSHYEYHRRVHTGERPFVCTICGKGFSQRAKVTRHMSSHTAEKSFVCQQCGRGFVKAESLKTHYLRHTGDLPFACPDCNKRFVDKISLKKHLLNHTEEKSFSCVTCGKSFSLKWTLDLHLRTHSSDRPFACDKCTRAFTTSQDLQRHLMIHSEERPWKCGICGTMARRKDNIDRHIRQVHNFHSSEQLSFLIKTSEDHTGKETTKVAIKTNTVTNQSEILPRVSQDGSSTALVKATEEEFSHSFQNHNSHDKLNALPRSECDEANNNENEAHNTFKTIVEDLVQDDLLPSSVNKNRFPQIIDEEVDAIQGIFEMIPYVPSQGETVVHEEDGSTHIVLKNYYN